MSKMTDFILRLILIVCHGLEVGFLNRMRLRWQNGEHEVVDASCGG
jgi:hypothetical protein